MTIEEVIAEIEAGNSGMMSGGVASDVAAIEKALRSKGWVDVEAYSECGKATREFNLQKEGKKVNVLSAVFIGNFVDWNVRSV